jgi:hypothetical protein
VQEEFVLAQEEFVKIIKKTMKNPGKSWVAAKKRALLPKKGIIRTGPPSRGG